MKTRRTILMGFALAVTLGVAGFQINASSATACVQHGPGGQQPPPPPGQRGPGGPRGEDPIFRELNLSDAQKQQVKTIREKQRTDSEAFHEQLRDIGEQMRLIVEAGNFDEAAARTLLAKESQIETELKLTRLRADNAMYNLLTAEQKARLDELRKNRPMHRNDN